MSYDGPTPTKFGRPAGIVAEPFRPELMHVYRGAPLRETDFEPPIEVLDQEDLFKQGIDTSALVKGAQKVDALGSCTANATTVSAAQHLYDAGKDIQCPADAVKAEEWAIEFYHACTDQTGDPSSEWPPTDCGSTGIACCQELIRQKLITSYQSASNIHALASLLQTGSVIVGAPWFNDWMEPDALGFVDGNGSIYDLQRAIASGVAGGHETCISALECLKLNGLGLIDPDASHVRVRNSWSKSFGDNGSYRIHLSTYQLLGHYADFKQFVIA